MIVKKKELPIYLQQLDALNKRIYHEHPMRSIIEDSLYKSKAGYKGEKMLEHYLGFLSDENYFIFHDLRLTSNDKYFQLDILLISVNMMVIIEVKNISGILLFDEKFNQLIRINNKGIEERFPSPINQVWNQKEQLTKWLHKHGAKIPPIETLVVNSNPNTILKSTSKSSASVPIIHIENLPGFISQLEKIYSKTVLSKQHIINISDILLKGHTELKMNVLDKFNLTYDELIKGVLCKKCSYTPMIRLRGKWKCNVCGTISIDGHLSAMRDYALLVNEVFTNQLIKNFLLLPSSSITKYLLTSANLTSTGMKKQRKYRLDLSSFHPEY